MQPAKAVAGTPKIPGFLRRMELTEGTGILTFESDWTPALGDALLDVLGDGRPDDRLDMGCVAAQGYFEFDQKGGRYEVHDGGKPATAFLFKLISQLQFSGTVPMIDVQAYAEWLSK